MEAASTVISNVTFELTDTEATSPSVGLASQRRLLQGVFGANLAINLMSAVMWSGIVRLGHSDPVLASMNLLTAGLMAVVVISIHRRTKPRKQRSWSVSFDDAGMHLAAGPGRVRTIPWRRIRSVNDTGTVFLLQYGMWMSTIAIVPRRAYSDQGAALWQMLQHRLIGSRALLRRPDSRIIVNTAAR